MVSVAFSPRRMISDLDRLALASAELQQAAEAAPQRSFWCANPFQRKISILKASFKEKTVQIEAAAQQHPNEKTIHSQLANSAKKVERALDFAAASIERETQSSSCASRIYQWFWPGLSAAQERLAERFVQSDKTDFLLNLEIVQDPAIVKELVRRNIPLRNPNDPLSSLLIAMTIASNRTELLGLLLKTKQFKTTDGFYFIRHCLIRDRTVFLNALLEKKRIHNLLPVPANRQIEFWLSLASKEGAQFLKKIGCDPNIRLEGKTPLHFLAKRNYSFPLSAASLVKILLDSGADPKATCSIDGTEKTAFEIAQDPYLQDALLFD